MNGLEIKLNELTSQLNKCIKNNCNHQYTILIKKNTKYLMNLFMKMEKIKSVDDINNTYLFFKYNHFNF